MFSLQRLLVPITSGLMSGMLLIGSAIPVSAHGNESKGKQKASFSVTAKAQASALARMDQKHHDDNDDHDDASAFFGLKFLVAFIAEVNDKENYVMIRKSQNGENKKITTNGAVVVKITNEGAKTVSLADLELGAKARFLVKKKKGSEGDYQALLIMQSLISKPEKEQKPTVQFSAQASSGSEGTSTVSLPVMLSGTSTDEVSVKYKVIGGTATGGGIDYTLANGTLTFAPGQTSRNIEVSIAEDAARELHETILVKLREPEHASMGSASLHTYTIIDND